MIIKAETIEEKPVNRQYNRHGENRITHYETLGNGISYCLRTGYVMQVVIIRDDNGNKKNK